MDWLLKHGKRALRITTGVILGVIGIIFMIPGVPGPGFPLVLLALGILAVDFAWARLLRYKLKKQGQKLVAKFRGKKSA